MATATSQKDLLCGYIAPHKIVFLVMIHGIAKFAGKATVVEPAAFAIGTFVGHV